MISRPLGLYPALALVVRVTVDPDDPAAFGFKPLIVPDNAGSWWCDHIVKLSA